MGVTIESKNHSIDLGYIGFNRLRTRVANVVCEDLGKLYDSMSSDTFLMKEAERVKYWEDYNISLNILIAQYKIPNAILDFLYAPDSDYKLTYGRCKKLYNAIKDYNDDIKYGYSGRTDCVMFKDFKDLVKDGADTKSGIKWF